MTKAHNSAASAPAQQAATPEASAEDSTSQHGYIQEKQRYLTRLKRIEGQVRGIHRMVEEDQYCIDILTQISAVQSALRNVGLSLLDDHMRHCVAHAVIAGGEEAETKFQEVADALQRFSR